MNPVRPVWFYTYVLMCEKTNTFRRERYLKTGMGKRYIKNRIKEGLTG